MSEIKYYYYYYYSDSKLLTVISSLSLLHRSSKCIFVMECLAATCKNELRSLLNTPNGYCGILCTI